MKHYLMKIFGSNLDIYPRHMTHESSFTENTKFTIMFCFIIENNFQYSPCCSLVPFPTHQKSRARKIKNFKYEQEQQKKLRFENAVYIFGPILISANTDFN